MMLTPFRTTTGRASRNAISTPVDTRSVLPPNIGKSGSIGTSRRALTRSSPRSTESFFAKSVFLATIAFSSRSLKLTSRLAPASL